MADVLEQTMPPGQWHRGFAARWESLQRAWVMDKSETRLGSSEAAFTMDQLADLIERYDPQPHMLLAQPGDMPGPGAVSVPAAATTATAPPPRATQVAVLAVATQTVATNMALVLMAAAVELAWPLSAV